MRSTLAAIVLTALVCGSIASAQGVLPAEKLAALKHGTVFVRVRAPQKTGTGFAVAAVQDVTYLITNAHAVATPRGADASVEVVLDPGTPQARSAPAKVVALDDSEDLAILALRIENPPAPLPFAKNLDVPETTPVFVLGYPFGETLAQPNASPAVTVSRASVSAQRRDADGMLEALQLDGELNPGNSGGPIVNGEGEVLGVAVAKLNLTNISFGVPAERVRANLRGRVSGMNIEPATGGSGALAVDFTVRLIDPLGRVTAVSVMTSPEVRQRAADAGKPGEFNALVEAQEHTLVLNGGEATGRVTVRKADAAKGKQLFQIKLVRNDGDISHTSGTELPLSLLSGAQEAQERDPEASPASEPPEDFGKPARPLDTEKLTKLPGEVQNVAVAGDGRYLVLKLENLPALTVYDTFKGEIAKHIRLPAGDIVFGAGGNTAVVYLADENLIQTYDLSTCERRKTKPNPFGRVITHITMGHSRGGRALVRHHMGAEATAGAQLTLLDTTRLEPIKLVSREGRPAIPCNDGSLTDRVHFRAAADLDFITEWATSHSPTGVGLIMRHGNAYELRYQHESCGYVLMGDDRQIYTEGGRIYTPKLDEFGTIPGTKLVPALGGTLFLGLAADGKLTVYQTGGVRPLGPLGEFPGWKNPSERSRPLDQNEMPFDRRITFLPIHGRIAFIRQDNASIVLRPFDLKAALDSSGVDYLVVVSRPTTPAVLGQEWSYQIEAITKAAGLTYSLELAPDNMKVSATGLVTWTAREPLGPEGETVIVLVKDKSGEESYHRFVVTGSVSGD
jgi:S1-C subfamily serine protease